MPERSITFERRSLLALFAGAPFWTGAETIVSTGRPTNVLSTNGHFVTGADRRRLNFSVVNGVLLVNVLINGANCLAMLDNGAEGNTLDESFRAAHVPGPVKPGGFFQSSSGTVPRQLVPSVHLDIVGQLSVVLPMYSADLGSARFATGRPVQMILGKEMFLSFDAIVRFSDMTIDFAPRGGVSVPANIPHENFLDWNPALEIEINHKTAKLAFDLGYSGAVLLRERAADRFISGAKLSSERLRFGLDGKPYTIRVITNNTIEIAGRTLNNIDVEVGPMTESYTDGLLGVDILKHFDIVLDFFNRKMWISDKF